MKRRLLLLAPLLLLGVPAVAQDMPNEMHGSLPDTGGIDPQHDPRVVAVTSHLGCLCGCGHREVSDCECGTAAHIRAEVAGMVSKGMGHDKIMGAMVDEYSGEILRDLPMSGFNLIAWLGPFVGVAGVGVWLWFRLAKWRKNPPPKPKGGGAPAAKAATDPYFAQIDRELSD